MDDKIIRRLTATPVTIVEVSHNVDRNGQVVPVLVINPPIVRMIERNGVTLKIPIYHVTLGSCNDYNYDHIGAGSVVYLNTNDLEYVESTNSYYASGIVAELADEKSVPPDVKKPIRIVHCPSCNHILHNYGGTSICINPLCPAQVLKRCLYFLQNVGVFLHGPFYSMLCKAVANKSIVDVTSLYTVTEQALHAVCPIDRPNYALTFKDLIGRSIRNTSLLQLILALDIFCTSNMLDELPIRSWLSSLSNKYHDIYPKKVFDIAGFVTFIDDIIKSAKLEKLSDPDADLVAGYHDQILRLEESVYEKLHTYTKCLNDYQIALCFNYISNQNTRKILRFFHSIQLVRP